MTVEEFGNKTVTITLNKQINVMEDLGEDILKEIIKDPNPLYSLLSGFYNSMDDIRDLTDFEDYKITIE